MEVSETLRRHAAEWEALAIQMGRRHAEELAKVGGKLRRQQQAERVNAARPQACGVAGPQLPPRLFQTLSLLMLGDSEKEVAAKMGLSVHTVHVYVKGLYKRYAVSSRAELLARAFRARYEAKQEET